MLMAKYFTLVDKLYRGCGKWAPASISMSLSRLLALALAGTLLLSLNSVGARAGGPTTERVSVSSTGVEGNSFSFSPSVSADGRFIAFDSDASNLVPNDVNGWGDVFVRDSLDGTTTLVSVDSEGNKANHTSFSPSISADGRFVAFNSFAMNLVPNDTNGVTDVFVHDMLTGATRRASVD